MCGIAGIFRDDPRERVEDPTVAAMVETLVHRGPDGRGIRCGAGYGLGHRRLSIIDIDGGQQPMEDGSGKLWVTYNGEIYNYLELTAELRSLGFRFQTGSDTEVLLHGYRAWGERLPEKLLGMFAFVIVDEASHSLFAARDRLGKKPLHYMKTDGGLLFGSEIKAILANDASNRVLRPEAMAQFLCLRYLPDPLTVYRDIEKLPPGHRLIYRDGVAQIHPYWRLSSPAEKSTGFDEMAEELRALLDDAVRIRLMSEVPLGAFLSGGVDSFAVVDSMARSSSKDVIACSMGFEDPRFDERPHARAAAAHAEAVLHEGVVGVEDLLEQDWFARTFDEPFSDSSAIPTYHVSRLARQHVTVALSGDGGDESFAGYRRYRIDNWENEIRRLAPKALWGLLGSLYPKADFLPRWMRFKRTFENMGRSPAEAYARSVSANLPEEVLGLLRADYRDAEPDPLGPVRRAYEASGGSDALSRAALADFATYLPGDILTKVDRASMAVSLEVRAPFLDHRLVEFAARIPTAMKFAGHRTKGFLRRALHPRLGRAAMDRPKQGFSVPLRNWMAGDLGDALGRSLAGDRLAEIVNTDAVRKKLEQHRGGSRDHSELLWGILILDRFLECWVE